MALPRIKREADDARLERVPRRLGTRGTPPRRHPLGTPLVVARAGDGVLRAVVAVVVLARHPEVLQRFLAHEAELLLHQLGARLQRVQSPEGLERAGAPAIEARDLDAAVGGSHVSLWLALAQPIAHHRQEGLGGG